MRPGVLKRPRCASSTASEDVWASRTTRATCELAALSALYEQKSREHAQVLDALESMIATQESALRAACAAQTARTAAHRSAMAQCRAREAKCAARASRLSSVCAALADRLPVLAARLERLQEDLVVRTDGAAQCRREAMDAEAEARAALAALAAHRAEWDECAKAQSARRRALDESDAERERLRESRAAATRAAAETELARRTLYAQCEELRGTIRVHCRVKGGAAKPNAAARDEAAEEEEEGVRFLVPDASATAPRRLRVCQSRRNVSSTGQKASTETFTFDRVFDGAAAQAAVYAEVEPLVNCAVDGYRVCIFAYGQTGSGKTHTMEGDVRDAVRCGIAPRALQTIFQRQEQLRADGWSYTLSCYFIEIYNDVIRDLQQDPAVYEAGPPPHVIKHNHENGTTSVTGVVERRIVSLADFHSLYAAALRHRSTAKTQLNDRSSRSHSLLVLRMEGDNATLRQRSDGALCLVDLAGSERVNESGAQGQQFKEAVNINRSLLDLGKCIHALQTGGVAPWRNCKLTYLLQNYLGGKGAKMLMIVTVSEKEEHAAESLNSLRFASRVNQTVVGPSVKRVHNY